MAKAKKAAVDAPNPETMSKEALDSKREEISKYYQDNIPHLETQLKYEELLRDIEKTRAERLQAQMWIAQTMAPPPAEGEEKGESKPITNLGAMGGAEAAEEIKRTLKRTVNEQV
tara:strand:+ start:55 stop:399 length:345 start_codon:yes stop_codon:yes gene_type:complete